MTPPHTHQFTQPTRTRRALIAATLGACLVLGVTACTPGEDSATSSTSSTADSAQSDQQPMSGGYRVGADGKLIKPETRIPPKPTYHLPPDGHTQPAAEEFGYFFIKTAEYAWNSGDAKAVTDLCTPDTTACKQLSEAIGNLYSAGGWVDGSEYLIRQTLGLDPLPQSGNSGAWSTAYWVTVIDRNRYENNQLETDEKRTNQQWEIHLAPTKDSWIVTSVSAKIMAGSEN